MAAAAAEFKLELLVIQSHMAQKPVLRGDVGTRVRVMRAGGQRRERSYTADFNISRARRSLFWKGTADQSFFLVDFFIVMTF